MDRRSQSELGNNTNCADPPCADFTYQLLVSGLEQGYLNFKVADKLLLKGTEEWDSTHLLHTLYRQCGEVNISSCLLIFHFFRNSVEVVCDIRLIRLNIFHFAYFLFAFGEYW